VLLAAMAVVLGLVFAFKLLVGLILLPLKLILGLVVIPFKILGALLKGVGSVLGLAFGLIVGVIALVVGVVLVPLVPLLILGGIVWLIVRGARAARPRPIPAEVRMIRG
jgi:hypothetical protein